MWSSLETLSKCEVWTIEDDHLCLSERRINTCYRCAVYQTVEIRVHAYTTENQLLPCFLNQQTSVSSCFYSWQFYPMVCCGGCLPEGLGRGGVLLSAHQSAVKTCRQRGRGFWSVRFQLNFHWSFLPCTNTEGFPPVSSINGAAASCSAGTFSAHWNSCSSTLCTIMDNQ